MAPPEHRLRRPRRPRRYFLAALFISLGGFLNGFDTGSIGSITEMPAFQGAIAVLTPTMRGLTVSFLLLAGTVPSLFAGLLADRFGHLHIVLAGALFFTFGAALEAGATNLVMLLVGRGFVGVGEGLYLGNLNVYICEIAPKARRGMMVAMPQAFVTLGTCLGYFTCYGSIRLRGSMQWRLPFLVQVAGGALLALSCCLLPRSPRWLMARSRHESALRSMQRLDFGSDEIRDDMAAPDDGQVQLDWRSVVSLFTKRYRFRTSLAFFILGMVQLCGIDGVLYYAPTLFAQAGLPADTASFVASGVSGILMFAVSVPAFLLADHWGRRTMVVAGGLVLAACMAAVGTLYVSRGVPPEGGAGGWAVIVLIFVFALTYVSTWGIVGKIYASEIQPAHTRATANALAQAINFLTNFLTAFITPIFLARSSSGPYFLFAGLTSLTLLVLWYYMPETRGRSLESIQDSFQPPFQGRVKKAWSQNVRRRFRDTARSGNAGRPGHELSPLPLETD